MQVNIMQGNVCSVTSKPSQSIPYIFINKVSFANVQVLDRLFLELCTGYTTECVIWWNTTCVVSLDNHLIVIPDLFHPLKTLQEYSKFLRWKSQ